MRRMLVVDDEETIRWALQELFMEDGWEVHCAADGDEAVAMIAQDPYDFMITDLKMPGLSGVEVIKEARRRNPYMGVAILTGYASLETAVDALRLRTWDYLTKPVNVKDLKQSIADYFDDPAAQQPALSGADGPLAEKDYERFLSGAGTELLACGPVDAEAEGADLLLAVNNVLRDVGFTDERRDEIVQLCAEAASLVDGAIGKCRVGLLKGHVVLVISMVGEAGVKCSATMEKFGRHFNMETRLIESERSSHIVMSEAI